ncbi:MAG TPA: CPCC family cysteine-rich protein [Verrucomicrobiae bacterium]
MNLACPCCGFRTIGDKFYGTYEICPVCGWEDDAVQLANPCSGGGANRESLHENQQRSNSWAKEKMVEFKRDPNWRPLNSEEVTYFQSISKHEHWTFQGETSPEFTYWFKSSKTIGS